MSAFVVLGTDTDAGKTTFALLWLAHFAPEYSYWKPVETGPSDTEGVSRLVRPGGSARPCVIHAPCMRLQTPIAPPRAAQLEGQTIPSAAFLAAARPTEANLLIETFGSPLSPLNESELQIELVRRLHLPSVLVGPSTLGAIGRTLAVLAALRGHDVVPRAVVLVGPPDHYAETELRKHWPGGVVVGLRPPPDEEWTSDSIRRAAAEQAATLQTLRAAVQAPGGVREPGGTASREVASGSPRSLPPGLADSPRGLEEWIDADRRCVWHPYTSLLDPDPPLAVVGAEAEFLHLADGRRIIDGISSWWTIQHGHRHPPLMEALREASGHIDHVIFAGVTHPWAARLAEELLGTLPWDGGRVFYSDNGSTAVEVALKLAYQYWRHRGEPERTTFVGFAHGYHGDTFGAMAVSRDPVFFAAFEPLLFRAEILPLEANRLDDFLKRNRVAAVVLEPLVQGAGGMRFHDETTLRDVFDVTRRHGVLFVADEVMTGLGRLGPFWAHQAAAITPDLVATAKTIAGGLLPLAATLVAPQVVEAFRTEDRARTFFHGHSFTAHPLACAVGVANLPLVRAAVPALPGRLEDYWQEALAPLRELPGVREVRCRGTIAAVELDLPGGYLAEAARTMRRAALEAGVLLRPLGPVLYALPPWCTSDDSLDRIADAIRAAIRAAVASTRN